MSGFARASIRNFSTLPPCFSSVFLLVLSRFVSQFARSSIWNSSPVPRLFLACSVAILSASFSLHLFFTCYQVTVSPVFSEAQPRHRRHQIFAAGLLCKLVTQIPKAGPDLSRKDPCSLCVTNKTDRYRIFSSLSVLTFFRLRLLSLSMSLMNSQTPSGRAAIAFSAASRRSSAAAAAASSADSFSWTAAA